MKRQIVAFEEVEQYAFVLWLRLHRILFHASPNGGNRDAVTGAILKRLGASKGFPDIAIFTPPPKHPDCRGVAIELKRIRGGQTSPEQRAWLRDLKSCGWIAEVCNGADAAIKFMESLGYGGRG